MIINLKKYLFIGAENEIADFFLSAQEAGFIEFITIKKKTKDLPESIRKLMESIKVLRKQPVKEPYKKGRGKKGGDAEYAQDIATEVLELTHEIEKLSEEQRFLEAEISRVGPFGNFSFEDILFIEETTKKTIQFYCVKSSKSHEVKDSDSLIYVGTDYDLDYYIGIHDKPVTYPAMIEMHFEKTAGELKNHLEFVKETLYLVGAELKGFAGHLDFLRESLLEKLDIYRLARTQKEAASEIEGRLFSIEGWVPDNKVDELAPLVKGRAVHYEPIIAVETDKIPTYMENKNVNLIGEDLVRVYDIPSATDKDPSGWVVWAFTLFFALIIADGGYGLLFLGLALLLKYKFPKLGGGRGRFIKLLFMLSTSCIIWGILTTSFFGMQFDPKNTISKVSIIAKMAGKKAEFHKGRNDEVHKEWVEKFPDITTSQNGVEMLSKAYVQKGKIRNYVMLDDFSDSILLELSLLIGVIHIALSLLRTLKKKWANIGWVCFAIGGYLYFPVTLKATSMIEFLGWIPKSIASTFGVQLLYGGLGAAIVLALIQKRLKGIGEIANVISVFADILSYLRLYALALASTIMARTFNEIGVGIGLLGGFLIILLGHAINLTLGTMGGVIHGLRLNFIEWYHYSFEGEGRLFNPLRKLKKVKQE